MTPKQKRFCEEYINNGLNATQSYMMIYKGIKNENTAKTNASRLLTREDVSNYIAELQTNLKSECIMECKERMIFLSQIVKGEVEEEVITILDNGDEVRTTMPAKLRTKMTAVDLMNKMDGSYVEKLEVSQPKTNGILEDIMRQLNED